MPQPLKAPDYPAEFPSMPLDLVGKLVADGFTFQMRDSKPFLVLNVDPNEPIAKYMPLIEKYMPYTELFLSSGVDFAFDPMAGEETSPKRVIPEGFPKLPDDLMEQLLRDGFYFLMLDVPTLVLVVAGDTPLCCPCICKYSAYAEVLEKLGVEISIVDPGFPGTENTVTPSEEAA